MFFLLDARLVFEVDREDVAEVQSEQREADDQAVGAGPAEQREEDDRTREHREVEEDVAAVQLREARVRS